MQKKLSATIKKIRSRDKGDYLIVMKKGLTWKYYQQSLINDKRGI